MTDRLVWLAWRAISSPAIAQDLFVLEGALAGGYGTLATVTVSSLREQGVSSKELKSFMSQMGDEVRSRDRRHSEGVKG